VDSQRCFRWGGDSQAVVDAKFEPELMRERRKRSGMKSSVLLKILMSLLAVVSSHSSACTLWAVAGEEAGGGTLVSKNRDWRPDHTQKLKLVRSKKGFDYFGLYAEGNNDPGMKAGINAMGLSVVSAATSISKSVLGSQPGKHRIMRRILESYASVDALGNEAEQVFSSARAGHFVIADGKKILVAEIGLKGMHRFQIIENGVMAHTNHYLDPELARMYNGMVGPSSVARLARITELLAEGERPFSSTRFAEISRDRRDGPDNSLWRSGHTRTMASWIVASPTFGAPTLRVVIANPGKAETEQEFVLDEAFWKE